MSKETIKNENGKKYTVKEKKPFYKKWWFWLIVIIILIAIFGSNSGSDNSSSKDSNPKIEKKTTSKTNTKKQKNKTSSEQVNNAQAVTLGAGQYKVGEQIKPGRYIIKAVNGSGNLSSGNGNINVILGQQADNTEGQVDSYTTNLKKGTEIKIEGINQTSFIPVAVASRKYLTQLSAGQWIVGKDIKTGRYKIIATAGSGNFSSNDGDINEILGTSADDSTGQVTSINVNLHKGEVINSDLESVKLESE